MNEAPQSLMTEAFVPSCSSNKQLKSCSHLVRSAAWQPSMPLGPETSGILGSRPGLKSLQQERQVCKAAYG